MATSQIILLCSVISLIAGAFLGALILSGFLKSRLNSDTKEALRRSRDLQETQEQLTITNEELQTSKEEMESAIEELSVLNEELRTRNQKLKDLNDQLTRIKDIHGQIIEAAPAAIFTVDHDLQLLSLNSACRRLAIWTGGKRGAGNSLSAVFDARFLYDTGFLKNIEEVFQNKEIPSDKDIVFADDQGNKNYYEFSVRRIIHTADAGTGETARQQVIVVIRDTTSTQLSTRNLEQREKLMRDLAMAAPTPIVAVDENGTIAFANTEATEFLDRSRQELLGARPEDYHAPIEGSSLDISELASDTGPAQAETSIKRKDGSLAPAILTASPMPGETEGYILVYSDASGLKDLEISHRRQSEADKEAARAEKLQVLNEISSGIAQEINNAMDKIRQAVDQVKSKTTDTTIINGLQQIEQLSGQAYRSTATIRNYVSDTLEQAYPETPLDTAVEEALRQAGLHDPKKYDIDLTVSLSCNQYVRMGRNNIIECVGNAVQNALEAMPGGGKLHITTSADDRNGLIEIRDTGKGMNKDTLKKAFEPYFSTKKEEGAGLGLTTVRSILQRNKGEISIESAKGKGTTVRLNFPLAQRPDK